MDAALTPRPAPTQSGLPGMEFWLRNAGKAVSTTGCRYRNGGYCCPHVILKGRGWIRWEGGEVELTRGDVFTLLPDSTLDYWDDPEDPWIFHWAYMEGPATYSILKSCGLASALPWFRPVHPEPIISAFQTVFALLEPPILAGPYRISAATCELFDALGCGKGLPTEELSSLADSLIRSQLHTGINVTELAAILKVERTTLFHAFRRRFKLSPIQYIRRLRIERAQQLLCTTDDKLSAIAIACGFRSEKYFIRTFSALVYMPPMAYRKANSALKSETQEPA